MVKSSLIHPSSIFTFKTGDTTDLKLFIAIALATLLLATCLAVMQVRNHRKEDSEEAENEESIE